MKPRYGKKRPSRPVTEGEALAIIDALKDGQPIIEVARRFDRDRRTIRLVASKHALGLPVAARIDAKPPPVEPESSNPSRRLRDAMLAYYRRHCWST